MPAVLVVAMPRVFAVQSRAELGSLEKLAVLQDKIQEVAATSGLSSSAEVKRDLDRLFEIRGRGKGFAGVVGLGTGVLGGVCVALLYLNSLRGRRAALRANLATLLVILLLVASNLVAVRHASVGAASSYTGSTSGLNDFMSRLVLQAASTRDEKFARQLLAFAHELDAVDADGKTTLHLAAIHGMNSLTRDILSQKKQDVDSPDAHGVTPLMDAAKHEQPGVVSTLLSFDASVDAKDEGARAAIHFAAEAGRTDIINMLLDEGADIDARDGADRSVLSIAYAQQDHELFAALIQRGAQVSQSEEGARLAHDATAEVIRAIERSREGDNNAGAGELERLRLLLGQGADPSGVMKDEGTPLHRVARAVAALPEWSSKVTRLGEIAAVLLDAGANPALDAGTGVVAYDITLATRFGDREHVEQFCAQNPAAISRTGLYGKTSLVIAVENNQIEVLRALLDHGGSMAAWLGANRSPMESAVIHSSDDVVLLLLENGFATPQDKSPLGGPLHLAAKDGRTAILDPALDAGYRVETKDSRGNTALHLASAAGQIEFAMALVAHGADALTWNNAGETPLTLAETKGHKDLYTRLKRTAQATPSR